MFLFSSTLAPLPVSFAPSRVSDSFIFSQCLGMIILLRGLKRIGPAVVTIGLEIRGLLLHGQRKVLAKASKRKGKARELANRRLEKDMVAKHGKAKVKETCAGDLKTVALFH